MLWRDSPPYIGHGLTTSKIKYTAVLIAFLTVIFDFYLSGHGIYNDAPRKILAIGSLILILVLSKGNLPSNGFSINFYPCKKFWLITSLVAFFVTVFFLSIYGSYLFFSGRQNTATIPKEFLFRQLKYFAFEIPLIEETIYRVVLCASLRSVAGYKTTIFISGTLFAFLHFIYGNPAIDNILGGYFLSWAFLTGKSIIIPVVFHSAGNALFVIFGLFF
ncbi:CPBP family intramembrane metalloprotease [candidate division WOR-3 bacterium]|nr:CPBP family intramembrane metalloprotease [candidate division WOR-3 bacterium]